MAYLKHRAYLNIRLLARVAGYLITLEAIFMLIPLLASVIMSDGNSVPFLISIGITGISGLGLMAIPSKSRDLGKRDAIFLTAVIWIVLSLFGMLPFVFSSTRLGFTDAFFETISGFTTTGTSVLPSLNEVPPSILLWRCVTQWIGGLGIILFTLAVVPMLNTSGGMQLFNAEVTGITHDKLRPRVSYTAKGLWGVYAILTIMAIALLSFSEMGMFDAVCYGLSTMSTGGFTTSDNGIHALDSVYVKVVVMIFMFLGGVNFSLLYSAICGNVKGLWRNTVLKAYVVFVIAGALVFAFDLVDFRDKSQGMEQWVLDPLFQSISYISSTGIVIPGFHKWGDISMVMLCIMMFAGACAGSTSGGAKIDRIIVLFKFLKNEFYKMMHPGTVTTVALNGKGTPQPIVMKTIAFLCLYVLVIGVGGIALSFMGFSVHDGFFSALQVVSNTGVGIDVSNMESNFSQVGDAAKWLLGFLMLVGRLELFTVLLIFVPSFWKN